MRRAVDQDVECAPRDSNVEPVNQESGTVRHCPAVSCRVVRRRAVESRVESCDPPAVVFSKSYRLGRNLWALGDGFLQRGIMVWSPHTAVCTNEGVEMWDGLDLGRGGKLAPKRGVYFSAPWRDVQAYFVGHREFPEQVDWEPCQTVTFDVPDQTGGRMWLVTRKNDLMFMDAAERFGVPRQD